MPAWLDEGSSCKNERCNPYNKSSSVSKCKRPTAAFSFLGGSLLLPQLRRVSCSLGSLLACLQQEGKWTDSLKDSVFLLGCPLHLELLLLTTCKAMLPLSPSPNPAPDVKTGGTGHVTAANCSPSRSVLAAQEVTGPLFQI